MSVDVAGWGSTFEAGQKPYTHVPVEIVPPGNPDLVSLKIYISFFLNFDITKTGDDAETLRIVEALMRANFKDGVPPHLQPKAQSLTYEPGSDQSRIFVTSHSEFTRLHAREVQGILRE